MTAVRFLGSTEIALSPSLTESRRLEFLLHQLPQKFPSYFISIGCFLGNSKSLMDKETILFVEICL